MTPGMDTRLAWTLPLSLAAALLLGGCGLAATGGAAAVEGAAAAQQAGAAQQQLDRVRADLEAVQKAAADSRAAAEAVTE
jgi:hypothetical protein